MRFSVGWSSHVLAGGIPSAADEERPVRIVGIVYDGPQPSGGGFSQTRIRQLATEAAAEALALTDRDFDLRFPPEKQLSGEWSLDGIRDAMDRLLADPEVDVIVPLGLLATNDVARRPELAKQVIAPFVVDIEAQGFPIRVGTGNRQVSGRKNLSYITTPDSIKKDLQTFLQIVRTDRVIVIADALVPRAIPEIPLHIRNVGTELGISIGQVFASDSAQAVLDALPADATAVYITPMLRMPDQEFGALLDGLAHRGIASFGLLGRAVVERGAMAGVRPPTDIQRLGRRLALNLQRILSGEDAGTLPVVLDMQGGLTINMRTVRATGVHLRWRTRIEAELLYDDDELPDAPPLTFYDVVHEAIRANVTLRAAQRNVAAGEQTVARALAGYRPRVDLFATGTFVNENRAEASFGTVAERTGTLSLSLGQTIFSERIRADVAISRDLQRARVATYDEERLDIALRAAVAFLDVLRAETFEAVVRENLALTGSNLALARRRLEIGVSGPAEVYRWESRIARDRAEVIRAQNQVHSARVVLNQVLHRPLEQSYVLIPPDPDDPASITCCNLLEPYVEGPDTFRLFREFSVTEALKNAPELQAIDAALAAGERQLVAAERSFWSPTIGLTGEYRRDFWRSGAGSTQNGITLPTMPPTELSIGVPLERNQWSVGIQAGLPLYAGGARRAEVRRIRAELSGLHLDRAALVESLETRVRTVLFDAGSTFPAIELAREAAEAARRNLELVSDAYSRGTMSIIDLLDAQNASLISEESAENAIYDFLIDLMRIERATSTFDFFDSPEGRAAWFARLAQFFDAAGMKVNRSPADPATPEDPR